MRTYRRGRANNETKITRQLEKNIRALSELLLRTMRVRPRAGRGRGLRTPLQDALAPGLQLRVTLRLP